MNDYREGYWTTRESKTLRIQDMDISHLQNTIRYLEKHHDFFDQFGGCAWDIDSYWYEDNSHLVDKKIGELQEELAKKEYYIDVLTGGQY